MVTWNEFAWATFLYGAIGGDRDYQHLVNQTQFLVSLRSDPTALQTDQIQQHLIKGFFNRWKCRVENTPQSAQAIRGTLYNLMPYLSALNTVTVTNLNLANTVNINNRPMTVHEVIQHCYDTLRDIGYRFGPTATSKLLHVLQPELFVMWDKDILAVYKKKNCQVFDGGEGYCAYLQIMQKLATEVYDSFKNASLSPSAEANQNPALYLSTQMNYSPPKTLAKYLDEYNWVTITNRVQVPPPWHP